MSEKKTLASNRKFRPHNWAQILLLAWVLISLFSSLIANERPLILKYEGKIYAPILFPEEKVWVYSRIAGEKAATPVGAVNWREQKAEFCLFTLVPYTPEQLGADNLKPPLYKNGDAPRHWLGTDAVGRDVLAGLIGGSGIALSIGLGAVILASFLGIFLGSLAGYFGDNSLKISRSTLIGSCVGLYLGVFYGFYLPLHLWGNLLTQHFFYGLGLLIGGMSVLAGFIGLLGKLFSFLLPFSFFQKKLDFPLDTLFLKLLEIKNAYPAMLLLILLTSVLGQSVVSVIWVIGLLGWTGIARITRSTVLQLRNLPFMEAGEALGLPVWRRIVFHLFPNLLPQLIPGLCVSVSAAIVAETSISFLGKGVSPNIVTWGQMLHSAQATGVWWMAVFPGILLLGISILMTSLAQKYTV